MNPTVALALIQACVEEDRVILLEHFVERMGERGMFWADVLAIVLGEPNIRTDGNDEFGRERWFLAGDAPGGLPIELLCVIDDEDPTTIFITIYWEE